MATTQNQLTTDKRNIQFNLERINIQDILCLLD